MDDASRHFLVAELFERGDDGLERALHVGLDDQRELLLSGRLQLGHHLLERTARAGGPLGNVLALLTDAVFGDLASAGLVLDHGDAIAGVGRALEAQNLDRHGGGRRH